MQKFLAPLAPTEIDLGASLRARVPVFNILTPPLPLLCPYLTKKDNKTNILFVALNSFKKKNLISHFIFYIWKWCYSALLCAISRFKYVYPLFSIPSPFCEIEFFPGEFCFGSWHHNICRTLSALSCIRARVPLSRRWSGVISASFLSVELLGLREFLIIRQKCGLKLRSKVGKV